MMNKTANICEHACGRRGKTRANIVATVGVSLLILVVAAQSQAPSDKGAIQIIRKGSQQSRQAPAEHFTGSARVDPLFQAIAPSHAGGALVTFEPGARTAWHTHPLGQILIVTAGIGRVQRWGDPVEEIHEADVVWIPPGQKHWHGAAPNSSMAHIAILEALDGKTVDWLEKVSDAQYGAAPRPLGAGNNENPKPKPETHGPTEVTKQSGPSQENAK
jgi:4-carboxymuconolactone decarboxylase